MLTSADPGLRSWAGEWIRPAHLDLGSCMHRVGFRSEIDIVTAPPVLPIRISADSRYVLWVNGREIGRGPVRSQPTRWTYDEYDIAPALTAGTNCIAVLVTYYGSDNALWQRARVAQGLGVEACLIIDAPPGWELIATASHWRAKQFNAWTTLPGGGILAALPIEIVDQRQMENNWVTSEVWRSWPSACAFAATHTGSSHRTRPPAYPYGALRPRKIPPLSGATLQTQVSRIWRPGIIAQQDPVKVVHEALGKTEGAESINTATTHYASPDDPILFEFDFGRIVSGLVELDFDAPSGTVFDLAYLERPFSRAGDNRYIPEAGARIIGTGGPGTFCATEVNGMRIAALLVTPPQRGPVQVSGFRIREHLYPFGEGPCFASSDEELESLWHAGVRTVQLNSSDALTDCPTREQRAWVGDAVVHISVHLVANDDWRLIERHLELSDSPRPDGLLPMAVAGDVEATSRYSIPDWSLHWLHGLYTYARASKHIEFVHARLATAQRILEWFETYSDVDGVLTDVPEWTLVDWSSVFTSGRSSILTALWVRGLREFEDLSEWVGNAGNAARARTLIRRAERGFESFWDEERGFYVDHMVDGKQKPAASQAANAAAIVAGLVPQERQTGIIRRITDDQNLVTRGWNNASPTVPLQQKVRDRAAGIQRIDWDVSRQIVRAEPFFSSVVHDAVAYAGCAGMIPVLLRRWSRFLSDGYDTFGECWEWGTPAHGWSSTPTRDLIVHVLGVEPLGLASEAYCIAPAQTDIRWLRADVPTPAGLLSVTVDEHWLNVRSPVPVHIRTWSGDVLERPMGAVRINLLTGESEHVVNVACRETDSNT